MPNWTKGKWHASTTSPPGQYVIHASGSPWQLAVILPSKDDFPIKANATLIAASPDLFEALSDMIEAAPDVHPTIRLRARAALNKALGKE